MTGVRTGMNQKVVDCIREHGPLSLEQMAIRLDMDTPKGHNQIRAAFRRLREHERIESTPVTYRLRADLLTKRNLR